MAWRRREPRKGEAKPLGEIVPGVIRQLELKGMPKPPAGAAGPTTAAQRLPPAPTARQVEEAVRGLTPEGLLNAKAFGICPKCQKGLVIQMRGAVGVKIFAACTMPGCGQGYPLPQRWRAEPIKDMKPCETCWHPAAVIHPPEQEPSPLQPKLFETPAQPGEAGKPKSPRKPRAFWACLNPACATNSLPKGEWRVRRRIR